MKATRKVADKVSKRGQQKVQNADQKKSGIFGNVKEELEKRGLPLVQLVKLENVDIHEVDETELVKQKIRYKQSKIGPKSYMARKNKSNITYDDNSVVIDGEVVDWGNEDIVQDPPKEVSTEEDPKKEPPKEDTLEEDPKKEPPKEDPKKEPPKEDPKKDPPKEDPKQDPPKEDPKKDPPKEDTLEEDPKKEPPKEKQKPKNLDTIYGDLEQLIANSSEEHCAGKIQRLQLLLEAFKKEPEKEDDNIRKMELPNENKQDPKQDPPKEDPKQDPPKEDLKQDTRKENPEKDPPKEDPPKEDLKQDTCKENPEKDPPKEDPPKEDPPKEDLKQDQCIEDMQKKQEYVKPQDEHSRGVTFDLDKNQEFSPAKSLSQESKESSDYGLNLSVEEKCKDNVKSDTLPNFLGYEADDDDLADDMDYIPLSQNVRQKDRQLFQNDTDEFDSDSEEDKDNEGDVNETSTEKDLRMKIQKVCKERDMNDYKKVFVNSKPGKELDRYVS